MSAEWRAADYRRDASDQTEEMNAAWRDEVASQRNEDWTHIYDDRAPTKAELDAEERDDRKWDR